MVRNGLNQVATPIAAMPRAAPTGMARLKKRTRREWLRARAKARDRGAVSGAPISALPLRPLVTRPAPLRPPVGVNDEPRPRARTPLEASAPGPWRSYGLAVKAE